MTMVIDDPRLLDLIEEYAAVEFDGHADLALIEMIRLTYSAWKHRERPTQTVGKQQKNWRQSILTALATRDGGMVCRHCGSETDLCIDHVFPASLGGTDDLDNLQLLCRNCNSIKGNRLEAA